MTPLHGFIDLEKHGVRVRQGRKWEAWRGWWYALVGGMLLLALPVRVGWSQTTRIAPVVFHVYKGAKRCEVRRGERVVRTLVCVSGLRFGAKQREGDRRTPQGKYKILVSRPSPAYGWFMLLNYPNAHDRRAGRTGSAIGIHGAFSWLQRLAQSLRIHWTRGCIALAMKDVTWLRLHGLQVGTEVIIHP